MISVTFLYLIVCCVGICMTYYGYERGNVLVVLLGGVISTIGIVGGSGEMVNDIGVSMSTSY